MKTNIALETVAILFLVSIINIGIHGAEEKTCGEVIKEMGKRQIAGVGACTKELNFKSPKEKKEKMNCVMKCVLKKEKLLNAEGKIDMESIQKMVESEMPPNLTHLREKGEAMFNKCKDEHNPKLDDKEENCASYGALIKCLMGMLSLCNA